MLSSCALTRGQNYFVRVTDHEGEAVECENKLLTHHSRAAPGGEVTNPGL